MAELEEFVRSIDVPGVNRALVRHEDGFVTVDETVFNMENCTKVYKRTVDSHGGDIYRRVRSSQKRILSNANRPLGNTPVRGTGIHRYKFPKTANRVSGAFSKEDMSYIGKRSNLIDQDMLEAYKMVRDQVESTKDSPVNNALAQLELHQVLTGGGYDNTGVNDTYNTAMKFAERQRDLPELDSVRRGYIVQACYDLRRHFESCGLKLHSLEPSTYTIVRADQNTDGVIGFPIGEKGSLPFSEKVARAIKAAYGVDLYERIHTQVVDRASGYTGEYRNLDAVAELCKQTDFRVEEMAPLITIFARIQRHGYKQYDDALSAKDGKARAVYVPDAVWGAVGAMIGDSWQKALMKVAVPDFPSLMNPEDQANTMFKLIDDAHSNGYVVLSTDESQYDASLYNSIMATIMEIVVKPFFRREYWPMVDVCTLSLMFKVLVFPDEAINNMKLPKEWINDPTRGTGGIKGATLVACLIGGLISGHKLTHIMGSMYGRVVCQKSFAFEMNYMIPKGINDGVMAGDDNCMLVPADMIDLSSEETAYKDVAEIFARYGLEVNPNKQIHIVYDGEPLAIFLQKAYHSGLGIKGIGSAARNLVAVNFSEHSPRFNKYQQWIAQISVMNNGWNSPFIEQSLQKWFAMDAELTSLFQTYGLRTFDILIENAGTVDDVIKPLTHAAFASSEDTDEQLEGIKLHIIPIMSRVAQSVYAQKVSEITSGEADNEDSAADGA